MHRHFLKFGFSVCVILTACATSPTPNFLYETSVRGERGLEGYFGRTKAVKALLGAGVVTDPAIELQAVLPQAKIDVSRWGLRYFPKDWARYQVVLEAKIEQGETQIRCRKASTAGPVGAPTLKALLAEDGVMLQRELSALVATCTAKAKAGFR